MSAHSNHRIVGLYRTEVRRLFNIHCLRCPYIFPVVVALCMQHLSIFKQKIGGGM